ncbi:MAG: insulinase family protein [Planctomycetes bacterium]|nr:insulinase family protein [Planctomycetota bacterium]
MPIHSHTYENGLVLVAEPLGSRESAAFNLLVPVGAAYDPAKLGGISTLCCELTLRGSGERDSRQFVEDLERLGTDTGESVSVSHTTYGGAMLAENLLPVLGIYADLIQSPHFPEEELEAARQGVIQELRAIEDEPAHKTMLELRRNYYGDPWGRPSQGSVPGLEAAKIADVKTHYQRYFRPEGAVLGVAGKVDWDELRDTVGELLGSWERAALPEPAEAGSQVQQRHITHESAQTQVGIAWPCTPYSDPEYFQAWGAINVLSGGMSSRLFTEVREKRGLCYSVHASCHTLRDRGSVLCHAGTTAERAQETLDVTMAEILRLTDGIESSELQRLKARMKSALILQEESSSARSSAIARDWYYLGRSRTLDEVGALVDGLSRESVNAWLRANPPRDFTFVTLGPKPLEVPSAVS